MASWQEVGTEESKEPNIQQTWKKSLGNRWSQGFLRGRHSCVCSDNLGARSAAVSSCIICRGQWYPPGGWLWELNEWIYVKPPGKALGNRQVSSWWCGPLRGCPTKSWVPGLGGRQVANHLTSEPLEPQRSAHTWEKSSCCSVSNEWINGREESRVRNGKQHGADSWWEVQRARGRE